MYNNDNDGMMPMRPGIVSGGVHNHEAYSGQAGNSGSLWYTFTALTSYTGKTYAEGSALKVWACPEYYYIANTAFLHQYGGNYMTAMPYYHGDSQPAPFQVGAPVGLGTVNRSWGGYVSYAPTSVAP